MLEMGLSKENPGCWSEQVKLVIYRRKITSDLRNKHVGFMTYHQAATVIKRLAVHVQNWCDFYVR